VLGQFEVGFGAFPEAARHLGSLVWSSGRTLEILLGGEDFNGELAERYGYVNRAIPDNEFEDFVTRFARRVSTFDRRALADIKHFVDASPTTDEGFLRRWRRSGNGGTPGVQARVGGRSRTACNSAPTSSCTSVSTSAGYRRRTGDQGGLIAVGNLEVRIDGHVASARERQRRLDEGRPNC